jgi:hypothetical protein
VARREFPPMVYAEIVRRAMDEKGQLWCEGCGELIKGKKYHVDHTIADGLILDKKRKLTAADGKLLGIKCCHAPKTAEDVSAIAKAKRVEAVHLNIKTRHKQPIRSAGFPKFTKERRGVDKSALPPLQRNQLFEKESSA